ncbi:response regulator [Flavisolibacter nicotianae]|uniref:response regulator n=1 Tax=Flavisolibacter nicotianae TaxID=2364882 RepID=UPI000EAF476E|nr:response regulator [Flavisolibacter nicotianae]
MTTTSTTNATILYIDDDSDDCLILRSSMEDAGNKARLICASDGEEAMQYLNAVPAASLPNLIVLDINMPRWDGRRTLSYLKSQPHLAGIPVVVFSTSDNKTDKEFFAQLGAASYFKKPYKYDEYITIVNNFNRYMKAS